jgi:putative flippase GtrA
LKSFRPLIDSYTDLGRQFSLFTLVGALGTLAHYVLLVVLVEIVGFGAVLASMAGAFLGAVINYYLNYRLTFKSKTSHRITFPRFLAVTIAGFSINAILMWAAVDFSNLHYILSQVIATVVVLMWNFVANRFWTFQEKQNASAR